MIVLLATLDPLVIFNLDGDGLMVLVHLPCRSAFLPRIFATVVVPPKVIMPIVILRPVSFSVESIDRSFEVKDLVIDSCSSFLIGRFHLVIQEIDVIM